MSCSQRLKQTQVQWCTQKTFFFKYSFITEVSQFKIDFLCQKLTRNDQNTMAKLFHPMEKEIIFLHEKLKSKNTIIILLLENVFKLKDNHKNENRSIHSNNDVKITQSEENNNKSTQSIEIVEREITLTEPLNIIVNDSDTGSRKSNQHYTGDKSPNLNDTITPQNKGGTNRKKTIIVGDSIAKNIEGVETEQENEVFCCCKINSWCNNKRHEASY